jgi:hypothetical protein
VVEAVKGVENSVCTMTLVPGMENRPKQVNTQIQQAIELIRNIQPTDVQVIYIDSRYCSVEVTPLEYEL